MNCKCIHEIERILHHQGFFNASLKNIAFSVEHGIQSCLEIPFSYNLKEKNGNFSPKEQQTEVLANFCPFCGKVVSFGKKTELQTLYICGAVTNNPNYKVDFSEAKEKLLNAGYDVVCPIDLCNEDDKWTVAMRKCIKALMDCTGVALLVSDYPSKGRSLELKIANELQMTVQSVDAWIKDSKTEEPADD